MSKYRTLNKEELKILEMDFVQFLVTNGILSNDWELLKIEEPSQAEKLIEIFSDIVFEKALSKIEFLTKTEPTMIICLQFLNDSFKLIGLFADEDSDIDFTVKETLQTAVINPPKGLKVVADEQTYIHSKHADIFSYLQQAFEIDNGKIFHALELSQKKTLN